MAAHTTTLVLLAGLVTSPFEPARTGAPEGGQPTTELTIRASVDGRSRLVLDDDTAQWQHFDYAAPGRIACHLGRPIEPTLIGGVEWFPEWPDVPNCENRDCRGCESSVFVGVEPALPDAPFTFFLEEIACRSRCSIVEYPSEDNGWRIVIEFNDNGVPGIDWYEIRLVLGSCEAARYCASTPNSTGEAARIDMTGSFSVSLNDTWLEASSCPPRSFGLFFYGRGRIESPFFDGYLCVNPFHPGLIRLTPVVRVDPGGQARQHLNVDALPGFGRIDPGSTWNFQFWFRDAAAGGTGSNLSDAVETTFCH